MANTKYETAVLEVLQQLSDGEEKRIDSIVHEACQRSGWKVENQIRLAVVTLVTSKLLRTNWNGRFVKLNPERVTVNQVNNKQPIATTRPQGTPTINITLSDGTKRTVSKRVHAAFPRALRIAGARLNVLLVGPAGTGKSYLAHQIAETLKLPFYHVSCSSGMSESALFGRLIPTGEGGTFEYARSDFVKAYEEGGVFLIDEIDAADSNVMVAINAALANGRMAVPNRIANPVAKRHKDFVCIAAANTFGTGADRMYVGRNQLDEATLDRFRIAQIEMDYDGEVEKEVCPDDALRERFLRYRINVRRAKLRRVVSMRAMEQAYTAKQAGDTDAEIDSSLFAGWSQDEISRAKAG